MPAANETPLTDDDILGEVELRRHYGLMPKVAEEFGDTAPILPPDAEPAAELNHYGIGNDHPFARHQ